MKSTKNKYILKIMIIGMIMAVLAVNFFCSKKEEKTEQYRVKPRKTRSLEPAIAKVEFQPPQPTSSDNIQANATLKDLRMKRVKYRYQWFVNGKIIPGTEDRHLEKRHYEKGDKVYCRVRAIRGIYESKIVKSKEIRIENSMPLITSTPWNNVRLGEIFHYTIQARDPDNDPLTYRLVSPLDMGIELDPQTGDIRWDTRDIPRPEPIDIDRVSERQKSQGEEGYGEGAISKSPPRAKRQKQLPTRIKIVFEVSDPDGATGVSSIELDFSPQANQPR